MMILTIKRRVIPVCTIVLMVTTGQVWSADSQQGQQLYQRHCTVCHGDRGDGVAGSMTNLSRGEGLMRSDVELKNRISDGKRGCPSFRGMIREREILDLIAYLRMLY